MGAARREWEREWEWERKRVLARSVHIRSYLHVQALHASPSNGLHSTPPPPQVSAGRAGTAPSWSATPGPVPPRLQPRNVTCARYDACGRRGYP